MANEFTGRYADCYSGDKMAGIVERKARLSLNAVKTNFGTTIAREVLAKKKYSLGNTYWLELVLQPGEKTAEETAKEDKRNRICRALYGDLRQTYPSLTLASIQSDVDKLMAGEKPTGIIQMFAYPYLVQLGLVKEEVHNG